MLAPARRHTHTKVIAYETTKTQATDSQSTRVQNGWKQFSLLFSLSPVTLKMSNGEWKWSWHLKKKLLCWAAKSTLKHHFRWQSLGPRNRFCCIWTLDPSQKAVRATGRRRRNKKSEIERFCLKKLPWFYIQFQILVSWVTDSGTGCTQLRTVSYSFPVLYTGTTSL